MLRDFSDDIKTILDTIVAPQEAARRLLEKPRFGVALAVSVLLPLVGGLLTMQALNAIQRVPITILSEIESALMIAIGTSLWLYLCFALVGLLTKTQKASSVAWALGVNASIVASAIPQLVYAIVVLSATAISGAVPKHPGLLLPSLGWLLPSGSMYSYLFGSALNIFVIWQIVLFSMLLVVFRLPAWSRWALGASIAIVPPIIYILWAYVVIQSLVTP